MGLGATAILGVLLMALAVGGCGGAGKAATSTTAAEQMPLQMRTEAAAQDSPETPARFSEQKTRRYLTFGRVAGPTETRAAAVVVERYYRAVAVNDGATACRLMYPSMAQATPETIGPLAGRHESCATVMTLLFRTRDGSPTRDVAGIVVAKLRVKGARGIALLRSPTMHEGEIVLRREGRRWMVLDRLGSVLPVPTL
jgi:hypothetical protein